MSTEDQAKRIIMMLEENGFILISDYQKDHSGVLMYKEIESKKNIITTPVFYAKIFPSFTYLEVDFITRDKEIAYTRFINSVKQWKEITYPCLIFVIDDIFDSVFVIKRLADNFDKIQDLIKTKESIAFRCMKIEYDTGNILFRKRDSHGHLSKRVFFDLENGLFYSNFE